MATTTQTPTHARPTTLSWVLLALLGLIWGASFLGTKLALDGFGPISIAAIRISLAAVILTAISFATGHGLPDRHTARGRKIWLHALGMALFTNAVPFSLLSWGQIHVTSAFAGITMAVVPLLVLPLAHFLVPGEGLTPRKTVGFVIGFVGVVILIGPDSFQLVGADTLANLARFACIGAACCYAIGSIITRRAPAGSMLSFSAAALSIAAILLLPVAFIIEGVPSTPSPTALAGIIFLGLFPTALATVMLVYIIQSAGPSFLSLVNYQVPVWAVILGLLALNESLPSQFFGALALILAGLSVAQAKFPTRRRKKA